jgi:hypothetical protein
MFVCAKDLCNFIFEYLILEKNKFLSVFANNKNQFRTVRNYMCSGKCIFGSLFIFALHLLQ